MTCEEEVRAAQNPQAALLALARALDRMAADRPARDTGGWGEWPDAMVKAVAGEHAEVWPPHDAPIEIIQHGDTATVELPPVDAGRRAVRLAFARDELQLTTALGDDEDWYEAYAQGGPMWLYLGNRELVMSYPLAVKQAMIRDVEQDSVRDAADMGRDILKVPTDETPKVTLNDW